MKIAVTNCLSYFALENKYVVGLLFERFNSLTFVFTLFYEKTVDFDDILSKNLLEVPYFW